jgi:hypothetical protein
MKKFWIWLILTGWMGAVSGGCALTEQQEALPTLIPQEQVPTVIAMTAQALDASSGKKALEQQAPQDTPADQPTATPQPTFTPTAVSSPTPTVAQSSPTPNITLPEISAEPTLPSRVAYGEIQIQNPGPSSRVVSPLEVRAYITPGEEGAVHVALYGEDGRLLVRKVLNLPGENNEKVYLREELDFEIPLTAETARLEISTYDEYGRVIALATQDLLLLSSGDADINPPDDFHEGIIIQQPHPKALIQGDELIVSGITRYAPHGQLYVEVLDFEGKVIASRVIGVSKEDLGDGYRPFAGEIPFQVDAFTMVRVLVYARDGQMSSVQHISSVVVSLGP